MRARHGQCLSNGMNFTQPPFIPGEPMPDPAPPHHPSGPMPNDPLPMPLDPTEPDT